jgi:hypothetical protein
MTQAVVSEVRRDSHNSNQPPSLDLPWKKPKRTKSLRKKSGLKVVTRLFNFRISHFLQQRSEAKNQKIWMKHPNSFSKII